MKYNLQQEKSLRDMDFDEVSIKYEGIFENIIGKNEFINISNNYRTIYQQFIRYKNKGYNSPSAMGRDKVAYARNVIYGWFIEDLIIKTLEKNPNISSVKLFGSDKIHNFVYDHSKKTIKIDGNKTTDPDIEIITKSNERFLVEIKSANKGIFTIKKGNVETLFRSVAYHNCYCLIMMIDLSNGLFCIKDLTYFDNQRPFSNANMEGQICYNFPQPDERISMLSSINFDIFKNLLMLENIWVKKFRLLKIAIEKQNKKRQRIIINKIKIEKIEEEKNIYMKDLMDKIQKIKKDIPQVDMSWEKIEMEITKI